MKSHYECQSEERKADVPRADDTLSLRKRTRKNVIQDNIMKAIFDKSKEN